MAETKKTTTETVANTPKSLRGKTLKPRWPVPSAIGTSRRLQRYAIILAAAATVGCAGSTATPAPRSPSADPQPRPKLACRGPSIQVEGEQVFVNRQAAGRLQPSSKPRRLDDLAGALRGIRARMGDAFRADNADAVACLTVDPSTPSAGWRSVLLTTAITGFNRLGVATRHGYVVVDIPVGSQSNAHLTPITGDLTGAWLDSSGLTIASWYDDAKGREAIARSPGLLARSFASIYPDKGKPYSRALVLEVSGEPAFEAVAAWLEELAAASGAGTGEGMFLTLPIRPGIVGTRTSAPDLALTPGGFVVGGTRGNSAPAEFLAVVQKGGGRFKACYENGLRSNPTLAGRIVVKIQVTPEGHVIDAEPLADRSDLPDQEVVRCLTDEFRALVFPRRALGGIVDVVAPLSFEPRRRDEGAAGTSAPAAEKPHP